MTNEFTGLNSVVSQPIYSATVIIWSMMASISYSWKEENNFALDVDNFIIIFMPKRSARRANKNSIKS